MLNKILSKFGFRNDSALSQPKINTENFSPQSFSKAPAKRFDGWANIFTGMGLLGKDQSKGTFYLRDCKLNEITLDAMYAGDGIVKTIVNLIPEMMIAKGFKVEGDDNQYIKSKLESIHALEKITSMMYWARLYGGGLIVMGLDDGRSLEMPVDISTLRDVKYLHVFDRFQCENVSIGDNIDLDMDSENYGKPIYYKIRPYGSSTDQITVHHSRILRMDGILMPGRVSYQNRGWGESEIQACYSQLSNFSSGYNNSATLINDFVQSVFSVENLSQMVSCETEKNIMQRFEIMAKGKSIYNMIVKDNLEKYEKISTNVAGIPELLDRFMMALSAVTRIPVALLFGRSASGLNSTGEFDMISFYDFIIQQQEKKLKPVLEKLIRYIFLSKDGEFNGMEPENWSVTFNPIKEISEVQEADYKHKVAETDRLYIETGVLSPEEVRESRFGTGVFNPNTEINNSEDLLEYSPEEEEAFKQE